MTTMLRTGHRAQRDIRVTTHCGLVARALGSSAFVVCGEPGQNALDSLKKVTQKWGGPFNARQGTKPEKEIRKWKNKTKGKVVHLTMYGAPLKTRMQALRKEKQILVIVGAEKVPPAIYRQADYNLSAGNQPHSEIAALALFLHELYNGKELEHAFRNAKIRIKPQLHGKKIKITQKQGI